MSKGLAPITIPIIKIEEQPMWEELIDKYQTSVVLVGGGKFNLTDTYFYLVHTRDHSTLLHSVSSHLYSEIGHYAKHYDYSYRLLKSVVLESFFSLRESIAGLVNLVYNLGENARIGTSNRILEGAKSLALPIVEYLNALIPTASRLGAYLENYRHPYVHREDLSCALTPSDMIAALFAKDQKRITDFIIESFETSQWIQGIEASIAGECAVKLELA